MQLFQIKIKLLAILLFFSYPISAHNHSNISEVFYNNDPNFVLLEYYVTPVMLSLPDTTARIMIFGDGRSVVHYPSYMKKAGNYEFRLENSEVNSLLSILISHNILNYDSKLVQQKRNQIHSALKNYYYESDTTLYEIVINIDSYIDEKNKKAIPVGKKRIVARNIPSLAQRYPSISELTQLSAALDQINMLLDDSRLIRLKQ